MSRRIIIASVAAGVVAVAAATGGFVYLNKQEQTRLDLAARTSADRFASAWSNREVQNVTYSGLPADQVAASFKRTTSGLGRAPAKVTVTSLTRDGDKATGKLAVAWTVAAGTTWPYEMPVNLVRKGDTWAVVATDGASMWAPGLSPKAKLSSTRTSGARGEIFDRNGVPIVTVGKVYDVAIDPGRASEQTVTQLEKLFKEPAGSLVSKLKAAKASGSKGGISVITLRESAFQSLRQPLDALKGVNYPSRQQPLTSMARPLLGSYGPVTAETITKSKGKYVAGDYAGTGGVQEQYNDVLGGTSGFKVTSSDKPDVPLVEKPSTDGKPLTLTLDTKTQKAAEAALVGTGKVPSALVAVDVTTGDLLAVASAPEFGMNRALLSHYAPGSTLKVVTTYSLLSKGMSPAKPVACPPSVTIEGTTMVNYEHESGGIAPFSTNFAMSCNTAFVGLSQTMGASDSHDAGLALGVGAPWDKHLGLDGAFEGSVPLANSKVAKATTAFGQGKTSVSPAALAVMAASVARGSYIEPALIKTPAVSGADRAPKPLDAKATSELRTLMRLVVTQGTAAKTPLATVPGGPVYGKTGTAEYGTATPLATHAWFVGWQGNIAFAVLVEDGKSGAGVAGPIAAKFLTNLQH
jgi:cell division protein FtsI/penicillin-binding protein 2